VAWVAWAVAWVAWVAAWASKPAYVVHPVHPAHVPTCTATSGATSSGGPAFFMVLRDDTERGLAAPLVPRPRCSIAIVTADALERVADEANRPWAASLPVTSIASAALVRPAQQAMRAAPSRCLSPAVGYRQEA